MMLKNKVAVIHGTGGAIGSAVARSVAREGVRLFLTGHHRASVEAVANEIAFAGGAAKAAEVDALAEQAVGQHLNSVMDKTGRVDIPLNAVGIPKIKILSVSLVEFDLEQFSLPIASYSRSYLLTGRLAARQMILNKFGAIMITAAPLADKQTIEWRRNLLQAGLASKWSCESKIKWILSMMSDRCDDLSLVIVSGGPTARLPTTCPKSSSSFRQPQP